MKVPKFQEVHEFKNLSEVYQWFQFIWERLDNVEQYQHGFNVETLGKLNSIDNRLGNIEEKVGQNTAAINNLQAQTKKNTTAINGLKTALTTRFDILHDKFDTLNNKFDTLNDKFDTLTGEQKKTNELLQKILEKR